MPFDAAAAIFIDAATCPPLILPPLFRLRHMLMPLFASWLPLPLPPYADAALSAIDALRH